MKAHLIKRVRAEGFKLICQFSGGEVVEYDMSGVLREAGPMVAPLRNPSFFAKVFIESGAPAWPNGYDVSPETIHRDGRPLDGDWAS